MGPVGVAVRSATETATRRLLDDPAALLACPQLEAICSGGPDFGRLIVPESIDLNILFTAGARSAFHVACHGTYAGGFSDCDATHIGRRITLLIAGMLTLDAGGGIARLQLSADRLGLHRSLLDLSRN